MYTSSIHGYVKISCMLQRKARYSRTARSSCGPRWFIAWSSVTVGAMNGKFTYPIRRATSSSMSSGSDMSPVERHDGAVTRRTPPCSSVLNPRRPRISSTSAADKSRPRRLRRKSKPTSTTAQSSGRGYTSVCAVTFDSGKYSLKAASATAAASSTRCGSIPFS